MSKAKEITAEMTDSVTMDKASLDALKGRTVKLESENEYLRGQLEWFKRQMFGHKTEKLPPGWDAQVALAQDMFGQIPSTAVPASSPEPSERKSPKAGHGRQALPADLPREDILMDVPESEKTCSCCQGARTCIGEDSREELHYVPGRFVVRVYRRPKYACRLCTEEGVVQAQPAPSVIDKGIPSVELVVWVIIAKYLDHLPLYRIA